MDKKRVLITGIGGQLGSYCADKFLEENYKIYGITRYTTTENKLKNIQHIIKDIELLQGDILDTSFLNRSISTIKPHIIINCAAMSHVHKSFEIPIATANITGIGVLNILEAIRSSNFNSKFLQFSTSELFGNTTQVPQDENTPFSPRSPYGVAKLFGHHITKNYRESYNMFACCAIVYNSESPRRGEDFVTKKIVKGAVEIYKGTRKVLELGNLNSSRDWVSSKDTIEGIYKQIHHTYPDEFVFSTGKTHSINDFLNKVFKKLNIEIEKYVKINHLLFRPAEVNVLCGNSEKAKKILDWSPKFSLDDIIEDMVNCELSSYDG